MPLLKDQPISCLPEWMAYDSKLSILSAQESTSIESKSRLAQNEIETQITSFLLRHSGLSETAARALPEKVTITEPLQRWHSLLTLSLFYADIAALQNSTLHRDQARYYEYKADAARDQLFDTGVGIVNQPVPKAPVPTIAYSSGANPHRILRARARFIGQNGALGWPSPEFLLDMSAGQQLTLSIAGFPHGVLGWQLFVGETAEALFTATPSPIAATSFLPITPAMPDVAAPRLTPSSQPADRYIRYSTEMWR